MKYSHLLLILLAVIFQGCTDFLELEDPTQITNTTFWKTESDAEKGLIAVYSGLKQTFLYNSQGIKNMNCRGDDVIARLQNPNIYNPDLFINTPSNTFASSMWKNAYILIYRANQVLDNVPGIEMEEKRKAEILGEAKALRGIAYFILATNFKEVPLALNSSPDDAGMYPALNTSSEVWDQIIRDFSEAKAVLNEQVENVDLGRMTKFAAAAFLGKAYLYNEEWAEAVDEFEYILTQGDFELIDDVNDNFSNKNENNKESIFEVQYEYFETSGQTSRRAKHFAPPGVGAYVATPSNWIFNEFQKEKTVDGDFDPRMYATFIWNYPGAEIYQQSFSTFFADDLDYIAWKKYQLCDLSVDEANLSRSDINERIMRLSHVLLMYAEALNESGSTELAYETINRIRQRANLSLLPDGLSQQEMREEIIHQRVLE
ncbi:MAG: RagB/SusD family nutrient uptake outer membrane protein, partial [Draconibacterium sp.]